MHPLCHSASAQLRTRFRGLEMTLSSGRDPFMFSVVKELKGRKKSERDRQRQRNPKHFRQRQQLRMAFMGVRTRIQQTRRERDPLRSRTGSRKAEHPIYSPEAGGLKSQKGLPPPVWGWSG